MSTNNLTAHERFHESCVVAHAWPELCWLSAEAALCFSEGCYVNRTSSTKVLAPIVDCGAGQQLSTRSDRRRNRFAKLSPLPKSFG